MGANNVYSQYVFDPTTHEWVKPVTKISYDDLSDQPVRNAIGKSPEAFVNLAGLDVGRYSLSGYYKLDSAHDLAQTQYVLDLVVMTDDVTGKRVLTYPTVESGEQVVNIVTYDNGIVANHTKQKPGVSYWKSM